MVKSREYMSHYPEWYWADGLHDASIIDVKAFEFPFDYNKFAGEKSKYNRNLLVLKINSKGALYDNSVEEIHLYNYKILTPDISLNNLVVVGSINRTRQPLHSGDRFAGFLLISRRFHL